MAVFCQMDAIDSPNTLLPAIVTTRAIVRLLLDRRPNILTPVLLDFPCRPQTTA
jgi:hypothetical protein